MKKFIFLFTQITFILPSLAQESTNPINNTVQGLGFESFDMTVGFVNAKRMTEGSAYYFENWNTESTIYIKDKGRVKIEKVNINLFDNTLEAIYDDNSVFTFNSDNLLKIVINAKVFRIFEINNEPKILEQFFKGDFSIYRHYSVIYTEGSANPMLSRKTNKFIKKAKYYLYRDDKLTMVKMTKKSFAKLLHSEKVSPEAILNHIKENKLSINKEDDLIQVLNFISN